MGARKELCSVATWLTVRSSGSLMLTPEHLTKATARKILPSNGVWCRCWLRSSAHRGFKHVASGIHLSGISHETVRHHSGTSWASHRGGKIESWMMYAVVLQTRVLAGENLLAVTYATWISPLSFAMIHASMALKCPSSMFTRVRFVTARVAAVQNIGHMRRRRAHWCRVTRGSIVKDRNREAALL
jgi:hypothetical protein